MTISHIPRGFNSITPYFLVKDADKFASFLNEAFAAEVIDNHREDGVLIHGAYKIFGSMIEASEGRGEFPARVMSMHLYVPDCDAVYQKALEAGGTSLHEVMDEDAPSQRGDADLRRP